MLKSSKISILFAFLVASSLCFSFNPLIRKEKEDLTFTVRCLNALPYGTSNINLNTYLSWYAKLGESTSGNTYEPGHVFSRHIAINYACTSQQKQDRKTVFYDEHEFYKILNKDDTGCAIEGQNFNFFQTKKIASASDYIKGIDCTDGKVQYFSSYFVEYKRAVQNAHPSQDQYFSSQKVTVHTFYPKR